MSRASLPDAPGPGGPGAEAPGPGTPGFEVPSPGTPGTEVPGPGTPGSQDSGGPGTGGGAGTVPRVLVVWCPDWPVTAVGLDASVPAAVVASGRVEACSAAARATGVRRGQRLRDAQRHCPGLVVRDRDPDAEGRLFETVAAAVSTITPWVEVVRPGVCAIPVRGAARYHGGVDRETAEESLRIHVQDTVVERGFDCGVGIADGLFAAELAARTADGGAIVPPGGAAEFLAPYPVTVLNRPELADLLPRLGIRTLGAFAALPARHVASRFGADEVRAHRLARGLDARPPAPRPPHADLSVTTEFDPPAAAAEQVVFAAKALAERLHEALAAEALTCVRIGVEVTDAHGRTQSRLWRYDGGVVGRGHGGETGVVGRGHGGGSGTLSALAVAERVRWQLSSWEAPPDEEGVGGIVLLRLLPDQLVPDEGRQEALWGQVTISDRIMRAAARVQAMLGHQAITRPYPAGGRAPGERVVRVPVGDLPPGPAASEGRWPGRIPDPAPAVVHPDPLPVRVTGADGAPVTVSARCAVSAPPRQLEIDGRVLPVTAWAGPWPARERWWDPARFRRRARFQVVTADGGARLLVVEGGRWYVEADYA
ncbi:DNA polymerase Y family protein [Actinoallomurus rhizosphaericola]|uniref:DNA polymerase Y family protein n=1 Tax=Actinoallomurus rhizosphaericola TaxID=2952536 RepID=UPI00273A5F66|nr:DNA polymerase Y family protein [Actinoallomurus rhizosphaericola]